jgi:hypothetical protein
VTTRPAIHLVVDRERTVVHDARSIGPASGAEATREGIGVGE